MGRYPRCHSHYAMVTLFDWQNALLENAIRSKRFLNKRDVLEDALMEFFASEEPRCAELIETKKLIRAKKIEELEAKLSRGIDDKGGPKS